MTGQTSDNKGWKLVFLLGLCVCVCVLVILAYESIVLCKCSGNVLIGYLVLLDSNLLTINADKDV